MERSEIREPTRDRTPDFASLIRATIWIVRSDDKGGWNQKAGSRPAVLLHRVADARAELGSTRALKSYFFLAFLAFFAFFAFFAFLAIVSSQGLMDGNATREACSAEGQPRNILEM
jgi:hypothetical protein